MGTDSATTFIAESGIVMSVFHLPITKAMIRRNLFAYLTQEHTSNHYSYNAHLPQSNLRNVSILKSNMTKSKNIEVINAQLLPLLE